MRLDELFSRAGLAPDAVVGNPVITSLESDSRRVGPGALFVCMPGVHADGHEFIAEAANRGAAAVLVRNLDAWRAAQEQQLAAVLLGREGTELMQSVALLARAFFDDPTSKLRLIAVTGTNGKTTTAWMVRDALVALGRSAGYLGTLGFQYPDHARVLSNTTPFPIEINSIMAEAVGAGVQDMVMEASSHGLVERRMWGLRVDVGTFTNLTQDHLDFHATMAEYAAAKKLLFTEYAAASGKDFAAVLNADDPIGREWKDCVWDEAVMARERLGLGTGGSWSYRVLTYGEGLGDLRCHAKSVKTQTLEVEFALRTQAALTKSRVGGHFNVRNLVAACATLVALGYELTQAADALAQVTPTPGRFEPVPNSLGFEVLVDYAHTPDALQSLLTTTRRLVAGRLIVVFGCGGDRDRTKRPLMAAAATAQADLTYITSDNPRTEDPLEIIREVRAGVQPGAEVVEIADRRAAIHAAIAEAKPGDVVVIAGKGHEDYQIIGRTKYPMDDRQIARDALDSIEAKV